MQMIILFHNYTPSSIFQQPKRHPPKQVPVLFCMQNAIHLYTAGERLCYPHYCVKPRIGINYTGFDIMSVVGSEKRGTVMGIPISESKAAQPLSFIQVSIYDFMYGFVKFSFLAIASPIRYVSRSPQGLQRFLLTTKMWLALRIASPAVRSM